MFVKLETVSKVQLSQKNFSKWSKYNMKVTSSVFNKLQHFIPIKNTKGQSKAFRLTKNGINTGIFQEIPEHVDNALDEEEINFIENHQNINIVNIPNIGQSNSMGNMIEDAPKDEDNDGEIRGIDEDGNI